LLLADGKKRAIGQIDKATRTLRLIRSRSKHLMRVNNSYGINYYLIENGVTFDKVEIVDEKSRWLIPKDYLIEHCTTMNFKAQGFELQKFISLDKLNTFAI
jgi:beta-glucosidase/6-phospho-beta-glucosidase/beta-galactosidase